MENSSSENLLQWGLNNAQSIAAGWNDTWQNIILNNAGGLYASIMSLAQLFCLGAFLFFMVKIGRELIVEGEVTEPLSQLLMPCIGLVLLTTNLFRSFTFSIRSVIHEVSGNVLQATINGVSIAEAIRGTMGNRALQSSVSSIASQCTGLIGQEQVDCLESASQQIQELLNAYQQSYPNINLPPYLEELARGGWGAARLANPLLTFAMGGPGGIVTALTDTLKFQAEAILMGFQWAFANFLEAAMLLTALIGPLAIAGLLLPYQGKPFFAWLTGFFSLGMAEVSYNLITGLVAEMMVHAGVYEVDTFGFLVFISILAPGLALAIASGGGMAVFSVMTGGASRIVGAITGGIIASSVVARKA